MNPTDELVAAIREFHKDRQRSGIRRKYARLAEGAFEFFRGTDFLFARAWPELGPRDPGPPVLISGDLHLENFGAYITANGEVRYDINDFDEAIIAPCGFDVVRCATSVLLAAESWKLSPTHGTAMVLNYLDAYRQTMIEDFKNAPGDDGQPDLGPLAGMLHDVGRLTPRQTLEKAAKLGTDGNWQLRRAGPKFALVKPRRRETLAKAIADLGHGWTLIDIVRRFAGIGSLGLRRYQLLVHGDNGSMRLLSLKQAAPAAVQAIAQGTMPSFAHEAERVVWAERQLRGAPIEPLLAMTCDGMSFRLRLVIPDENRADLNRLMYQPDRLRDATAVAGRLTARSQRRGCGVAKTDTAALHHWAAHTTLDAVLAAAVRMADRVAREYQLYRTAYESGAFPR
jgi:uncharacterized protein (DUF2252 family)